MHFLTISLGVWVSGGFAYLLCNGDERRGFHNIGRLGKYAFIVGLAVWVWGLK